MSKQKKPKAVKAWALVSKYDAIWAHWTFDEKRHCAALLAPGDRWIRVEIRPVPARRRKARRKA